MANVVTGTDLVPWRASGIETENISPTFFSGEREFGLGPGPGQLENREKLSRDEPRGD